jgi:hypothetical protein
VHLARLRFCPRHYRLLGLRTSFRCCLLKKQGQYPQTYGRHLPSPTHKAVVVLESSPFVCNVCPVLYGWLPCSPSLHKLITGVGLYAFDVKRQLSPHLLLYRLLLAECRERHWTSFTSSHRAIKTTTPYWKGQLLLLLLQPPQTCSN